MVFVEGVPIAFQGLQHCWDRYTISQHNHFVSVTLAEELKES